MTNVIEKAKSKNKYEKTEDLVLQVQAVLDYKDKMIKHYEEIFNKIDKVLEEAVKKEEQLQTENVDVVLDFHGLHIDNPLYNKCR